ncbi:MAG: response regulator transcription factor, partial [Acidimicrobiia bacterium]|nr:response regulator transcription factor [Acidimicrobiia bacterium]
DLVFLDVQMPGFDGMEALKRAGPYHLPSVIFVTAHDKYAVRAFELHALDYVLKPVNARRFQHALDRAKAELSDENSRTSTQQKLVGMMYAGETTDAAAPAAADSARRSPYISRIAVKDHQRYVILKVSDVDWIQSAANYVEIHSGGRCLLLRSTLTALEEQLDPASFLRVHRTSIVNVDRVAEILPSEQGDSMVRLNDGTCLRLSRKYRDSVLARMYPGSSRDR